jgi:hypothetical protein
MTRDDLKAIIGGAAETLKLVADQPEFQATRHLDTEGGETIGVSFDVAIQLLDVVWDALDQELPEGMSIQDCQNHLKECWGKS